MTIQNATNKKNIRDLRSDRIFSAVCYCVVILMTLIVLIPVLNVIACSFSHVDEVIGGRVFIWPKRVTLLGYKAVFNYRTVWTGYRNTIFYTVLGTFLNVVTTMIAAYPLARKGLPGRKWITLMFTFTMIFSAGLVPVYMVMKGLNMLNTIWVMVIPGLINVHNLIVARTFIQSTIPDELQEAAEIDGCSDVRFFFSMVMPLSKAILAVLALYYAVGHWNDYFNAYIYLTKEKLFPLQLILRQILLLNSMNNEAVSDPKLAEELRIMGELLKYALIVVASAPIMCVYPFIQRYFIKGVMIGSLKG